MNSPVHTQQEHSESLRCYTHSLQETAYNMFIIRSTYYILSAAETSLTGASIRRVGGEVPVQRFTFVTSRAFNMTTALTLTLQSGGNQSVSAENYLSAF